jgi:hypothetical protein
MDWRQGEALGSLDSPIEAPELWSSGDAPPRQVRIACCSVTGAKHNWLNVFKMEREYERAELDAEFDPQSGHVTVHTATNIRLFEVAPPVPLDPRLTGHHLTVEGQRVEISSDVLDGTAKLSTPERLVLFNKGYKSVPAPTVDWVILESGGHGKRSHLTGPIDDAFQLGSFLCVRGTSEPWDAAAEAAALSSLKQLQAQTWPGGVATGVVADWVRVVNDDELTEEEALGHNLIMFGDPGSNRWIARALPAMPIAGWTAAGGFKLAEADAEGERVGHCLSMICPSPWHHERYIVLNAAHSGGKGLDDGGSRPRRADYAVTQCADGGNTVVQAGFFTNEWALVGEEKRVSYRFDEEVAIVHKL